MGKSTISMVIFNSYVSHYQRVHKHEMGMSENGVYPYDGKTGFIWASPRFKVIKAFERLIILIILIN